MDFWLAVSAFWDKLRWRTRWNVSNVLCLDADLPVPVIRQREQERGGGSVRWICVCKLTLLLCKWASLPGNGTLPFSEEPFFHRMDRCAILGDVSAVVNQGQELPTHTLYGRAGARRRCRCLKVISLIKTHRHACLSNVHGLYTGWTCLNSHTGQGDYWHGDKSRLCGVLCPSLCLAHPKTCLPCV